MIDTLVPQIALEDTPPSISASEVFGFALEKVAASDTSSVVVLPFSSTKSLRRLALD